MARLPIAIANDHAGLPLKAEIVTKLEDLGFDVLDLGTNATASVDYPDFGYAMAEALSTGQADKGVLICGSGLGISMAANRHPEVRAAVVTDALSARLTRQHNDANVICFGARLIGPEVAKDSLKVFLETDFEGGRHARRVDKLSVPNSNS